jgi:hypothetical protein
VDRLQRRVDRLQRRVDRLKTAAESGQTEDCRGEWTDCRGEWTVRLHHAPPREKPAPLLADEARSDPDKYHIQ